MIITIFRKNTMPANDTWFHHNAVIDLATKLVFPAAAERRAGIQKRLGDYWIFLKLTSLSPF
jgi:hypothetical protein